MKTCPCGFCSYELISVGSQQSTIKNSQEEREKESISRLGSLGKTKWLSIGGFMACPVCGLMFVKLSEDLLFT